MLFFFAYFPIGPGSPGDLPQNSRGPSPTVRGTFPNLLQGGHRLSFGEGSSPFWGRSGLFPGKVGFWGQDLPHLNPIRTPSVALPVGKVPCLFSYLPQIPRGPSPNIPRTFPKSHIAAFLLLFSCTPFSIYEKKRLSLFIRNKITQQDYLVYYQNQDYLQ